MTNNNDIHQDEQVAASYDESSSEAFTDAVIGPTVDFLASLADGGPALEFAIGTGRIGLPLSERGIKVFGIELSEPMLKQMHAKPGAENIEVVVGDMATTRIGGEFKLVYLVYNTIMNLTVQSEQVACFRNAAAHLVPGGHFVIEVMVPRLRDLSPGSRYQPFSVNDKHLGMDEYVDFERQLLKSHHYYDDAGEFRKFAGTFRWVWPSELDLMAEVAGMKLTERYADWQRSPFSEDSDSHVSVWRK